VQKEAIEDCLRRAKRPLSVAEIRDCARESVPVLGQATVYRCIRRLRDQGRLSAVEVPGAPARFELRDPRQHRHHFHCRRCGRTFPVAGCPGEMRELAPTGFHVEDHEILLKGLCADCLREESST
jgi:Fur family ferric uptake transcriptional regulator